MDAIPIFSVVFTCFARVGFVLFVGNPRCSENVSVVDHKPIHVSFQITSRNILPDSLAVDTAHLGSIADCYEWSTANFYLFFESPESDSNRQPPLYKSGALPLRHQGRCQDLTGVLGTYREGRLQQVPSLSPYLGQ